MDEDSAETVAVTTRTVEAIIDDALATTTSASPREEEEEATSRTKAASSTDGVIATTTAGHDELALQTTPEVVLLREADEEASALPPPASSSPRVISTSPRITSSPRTKLSSLNGTTAAAAASRRESYLSTGFGSVVGSPSVFGRVKKFFAPASASMSTAGGGGDDSSVRSGTVFNNNNEDSISMASAKAAFEDNKPKSASVKFERPAPLQSQTSMGRKTMSKSMSFRRIRANFKTEEGAAPPMPPKSAAVLSPTPPTKSITPPPPGKSNTPPLPSSSSDKPVAKVRFDASATSPKPSQHAASISSSSPASTSNLLLRAQSRHSMSDARKSSSGMNLFGRGERSDTTSLSTRFAISKRKSGRIAQEQLSSHELAFLPGDLLKRLGESAGQLPPAPSVFSAMGAILFVDVSGFTALAEKLGKENVPVKASEKLAATITRVLQVLARVCLDGGGEVGKFCGDALLCVWEAESERDLGHSEHLAKMCAIEMLQQMENLNRLERVDLQIHGGIAKGSIVHFHFGSSDDELRWYLMSGEAVSAATTLVDVAVAGEFCCLNGTAKGLPDVSAAAATPRADGKQVNTSSNVFNLTRKTEAPSKLGNNKPAAAAAAAPPTPTNQSSPFTFLTSSSTLPVLAKHDQKRLMQQKDAGASVASVLKDGLPKQCNVYIPASLREQLNYRSQQKGEMRRRIAILFVEVGSLTMTEQELSRQTVSDAKLDQLNNAYVTMTRILHAFNGEVRDMLFDDKGCVYIGMFGAHEEEEDEAYTWTLNAVQAALAICHEIPGARAGVSQGTCFVGMAGVIERRTDFVVVGHEVNMAARYMSNAKPGQILVSTAIMSSTKDSVQYGQEQQIMVGKGKWAKLRAVYSPLPENAKHEQFQQLYRTLIGSASSQFVGRAAELSAIEKTMQKINTGGRSGVVVMEAPCGRGKSALVRRVKKLGRGKVRVVSGEGVLSERNTAYFPLRAVLESYTGIRPSMTQKEIKAVIDKLEGGGVNGRGDKINVKALALILPWIQGITGTGGKADVKPHEMADTLLKIIKLSFDQGGSGGGGGGSSGGGKQNQSALVVLDDAQWFDQASLEILLLLVDGLEKTQKICLLLTFRTLAEYDLELPFLLQDDTPDQCRSRQDLVLQLRQKCRKLKFNSLYIDLPTLAKAESTELAEKLLGAKPTPQCADQLFECCRGDPSFLMYTVRYLLDCEGIVVGERGLASIGQQQAAVLPKSCEDAILKRLKELLSADQLRTLEWAASAGGGTFDAQYVEDSSRKQIGAKAAVEALNAAADLDFCTSSVMNQASTPPAQLKWDFNHDLIFRAIWQSFNETRRKELLQSLKDDRKRLGERVKTTAAAFAAQQHQASNNAGGNSPALH